MNSETTCGFLKFTTKSCLIGRGISKIDFLVGYFSNIFERSFLPSLRIQFNLLRFRCIINSAFIVPNISSATRFAGRVTDTSQDLILLTWRNDVTAKASPRFLNQLSCHLHTKWDALTALNDSMIEMSSASCRSSSRSDDNCAIG